MTNSGKVPFIVGILVIALSILTTAPLFVGPVSADTEFSPRVGSGIAGLFNKSTDKTLILGSIFGTRDVKKFDPVVLPNNVQTLPLLQAPKNIDPIPMTGQKIVVVDDSALTNENTGVDGSLALPADFKPVSDQISLYTVREGDTISGIAAMYDVTPNTIRTANDIGQNESIKPGQVIVVLPVTGLRYTTKKGDTLASIAKAAGADASEIALFNGLSTTQPLAVNTTIIIPDEDASFGPGHNVASNGSTKTATKTNTTKSSKTVKKVGGSGYYACPINAIRTQGVHGNNGVDYGAPVGTAIIAAADGEVMISRTGWNGGYGTYIVIRHANGTQTLYAHMSQLNVNPGERVVKGQVIGKMGNTGQSTGPHIHFEVRGAANPC